MASFAQNKSRKQLELDRNRIKKEIKLVNKLLFAAKKSEQNALEDLKDLNQKISIREKYISTINLEVQSLSSDIAIYEDDIEQIDKKPKLHVSMISFGIFGLSFFILFLFFFLFLKKINIKKLII